MIIADINTNDKQQIEHILNEYGLIEHTEKASLLRKNAIACVAFNTCPLALAEAQRYLPSLIDKLDLIMEKYHLGSEEISIRMTGCPNGCARPYAAEIGLIGTAYGRYNLHIGGDRNGERLNNKYKSELDEAGILEAVENLIKEYSSGRIKNETFGDYVYRSGMVSNG